MKRLTELREKFGLSQIDLAREIGVNRQLISNWEAGKSYPNVFNAIKLANIFKCSVAYLMGMEGYNDKQKAGQ